MGGSILSILSSWILTLTAKMKLFRSGLKEKHVDMAVPRSFKDSAVTTVRAHYLERKPSGGGPHQRDLLIVPGFTAHADEIMSDLVWALMKSNDFPSGWRIVVVDLPLHNKNLCNFDGTKFPDLEEIQHYVWAFIEALGMGQKNGGVPLSLCGYSLGGNPCLRVLHEHPEQIQNLVLIAPAFPETRDSNFIERGRKDPRKIHCWQSLEDVRHFGTAVAGCHKGHLMMYPAILRGLVRNRRKLYGKHCHEGNFFADYASAMGMLEKEESSTTSSRGNSNNPLDPALLSKIRNPVLLLLGDRDACISSHKCQTLLADAIGGDSCTVCELADTGHYGGPSDGPPDSNILYESAPEIAKFLFR